MKKLLKRIYDVVVVITFIACMLYLIFGADSATQPDTTNSADSAVTGSTNLTDSAKTTPTPEPPPNNQNPR